MTYTNGDIRRLGEKIVETNGDIDSKDLELLQEFRKSFTDPLTKTFANLTDIKNKVNRTGIIAFRLKRIKTIINKAIRKPKMNLDRMGDIAGIRIILDTEQQVYKVLEELKFEYDIAGKIRDYIDEPKDIGYKSIHVYLREPKTNKRIEVQLRTVEFHNWSTLVEITDVLYKTRLKELGYENNVELGKFHSLISSDKELTEIEANHIYHVLKKYQYISRLSKVFRKNNTDVKKQWLNVKPGSRYFLIESSPNKIPVLSGFTDYNLAEEAYFERYKNNHEALIVLTSINKPSFEQISIAYANYILSYHKFINDIESILKELSLEALELRKHRRFKNIFRTYEELHANSIFYVFTNTEDYFINKNEEDTLVISSPNKISTKKQKELKEKINEEFKERRETHRKFLNEIDETLSKQNFIDRFRCKRFVKKHSKRLRRRVINLTIEVVQNKFLKKE